MSLTSDIQCGYTRINYGHVTRQVGYCCVFCDCEVECAKAAVSCDLKCIYAIQVFYFALKVSFSCSP